MVDFNELHKFARTQYEEAKALGSNKAAYLKGVSDCYYFIKEGFIVTADDALGDYNAHKEIAEKGICADYHNGFADAAKYYLSTIGVGGSIMEYTNSFDKKIMEYRGENWEEFVSLFTDEELEQMKKSHLIRNIAQYTLNKEWLIEAYLEEWAVEQVRNRIHEGTEHLLRLLYTFGD